jgi:hypothetical protein
MRSIYLLVFLLLSVAVLAEEAVFTISIGESKQLSFAANLGTSGNFIGPNYPPTATLTLSDNPFVQQLQVVANLPRCNSFFRTTYQCGAIKLCAQNQGDSKICKDLESIPTQTVNFTYGKTVSTVVFSYEGSRNTGNLQITISNVVQVGGAATTIVRDLFSLRGTDPINLGRVKEIIDVPDGSTVKAYSSTTKAPLWFDDQTGTSSTGRTETSTSNDVVYTCLNSDSNTNAEGKPYCDYFDENNCLDEGKDWYGGKCCGDAGYLPASGCQWYADKQAVCGQDTESFWKWAGLGDIGLITPLSGSCPLMQVVSNGSIFYTCTQIPQNIIPADKIHQLNGIIEIEGHDYICQGENLIECGGKTPYSPTALELGASVTINGKKNYCDANGIFAVSIEDRTTCENAALKWTGTQCCGEPDDSLRTYEDPYAGTGTAGVCYNGEFLPSGTFLDAQKTILSHRGEYYECDPEISTPTTATLQDTDITMTVQPACGIPLLNTLLIGTKPNSICTPSGQWYFTNNAETTTIKQTKWTALEGEQQKGCCPDNQCWDGKNCRNIGEYYVIGERGFLCQ